MERRISLAIFCLCFLLAGCKEQSPSGNMSENDSTDGSIEFPLAIEDGKRVVYRFAKMTPRGLRYFYDTVDVHQSRFALPDSVHVTFLSPINLDARDRENSPAVIAISIPGMWEETIFGVIDDDHVLHLNYINEIELKPTNNIEFQPGNWSATFEGNGVKVEISASLTDTSVGDHLAGKGKLILTEKGNLTEQHEIFIVYKKNQ